MPYNTAATCLHIDAQSGQLQVKRMSFGDGNTPVFSSQRRVMTPLEKRPCRSSTSESMARWTGRSNESNCGLLAAPAYSLSARPSGRCCALAVPDNLDV